MAEINIERKKKPVWPWILLLIVLALIGWAIYESTKDGDLTSFQAEPQTTDRMLYAELQPHQYLFTTV